MSVVSKRFPPEFKADMVRVARRGDLSITEVAVDSGISVESVKPWKNWADIEAEQSAIVQLRPDKPAGDGERGSASGRRYVSDRCQEAHALSLLLGCRAG